MIQILFAALPIVTLLLFLPATAIAESIEEETLRHFQQLLRFDTSDPPGREQPVAEYLRDLLKAEGIEVELLALEAHRPNVLARIRGNGAKRPLLILGHTDTVSVQPGKWTHPPFGAVREGDWIYGRGTVDDKDNVVAALMTMLLLKREGTPLDRDVIFLAEAGEEGATRVGIQYMVNEHFDRIDAEFCFAEGGGVSRREGKVVYAGIATLEKQPRAITLIARGPAGHGSVPLEQNALAHLAKAIAALADWRIPIKLNETTIAYFQRLAAIAPPEKAKYYTNILHPDPALRTAADEWFRKNEPIHASMIRSSMSPTIMQGGYRVNVIPSEGTATIDTRLAPGEDAEAFIEAARKVVNDPAVDVSWAPRDVRPPGESPLGTDAFKVLEATAARIYEAPVLPMMLTGGTDMAYLRARGVACYGIGPAVDAEDGPKGYGAHSDQERILEAELHRFVRYHHESVVGLAGAGR
ncbi:MAG: M20/M25/M40 family metallo-hydrolase [Gammaproteobacteria bacterium]|nr:M20/M25/M40 family metallo-hydrolase [Gammaproteobacteria bacterium]